MAERSFEIFADYFQFLLRDAGADWEDLADRWTPQTVEAMFIQGTGYVAIGTVRNMYVPVTVRLVRSEPQLKPENWDRIVHGGVELPSGRLIVTGVTDNGVSGGEIPVEPGTYHVRALYGALASLSADGLSGNDHYVIELWPATPAAPAPSEPEFVRPTSSSRSR